MKNQHKKHVARCITMAKINPDETERNITVNRDELREAKEQAKPGEALVYNVGPNRAQRREKLKNARYKATHRGHEDERAIVNNRGNKGQKVYNKMAYYWLRLGERRNAKALAAYSPETVKGCPTTAEGEE